MHAHVHVAQLRLRIHPPRFPQRDPRIGIRRMPTILSGFDSNATCAYRSWDYFVYICTRVVSRCGARNRMERRHFRSDPHPFLDSKPLIKCCVSDRVGGGWLACLGAHTSNLDPFSGFAWNERVCLVFLLECFLWRPSTLWKQKGA